MASRSSAGVGSPALSALSSLTLFLRFFVSRRRSHCHRHLCPSVISAQINATGARVLRVSEARRDTARRVAAHAWPGSRLITHLIEASPFFEGDNGRVTAVQIVIFNAPDILCIAAGWIRGAKMSTEIMTRGNFAFATAVYIYIYIHTREVLGVKSCLVCLLVGIRTRVYHEPSKKW